MTIRITIGINETDSVFRDLRNFTRVSGSIIYSKYGFDILRDHKKKRLEHIAADISSQSDNVLIGNAAYDLNEILYLIDELKKYNLSLSAVYIPSDERVEKRKQKAIEDQKLLGYRGDFSNEEIQRNFKAYKATLLQIKDKLSNTSIRVQAV